MSREKLIKKYGPDIVAKACEYFDDRHQHFTIKQFIKKCEQLRKR